MRGGESPVSWVSASCRQIPAEELRFRGGFLLLFVCSCFVLLLLSFYTSNWGTLDMIKYLL